MSSSDARTRRDFLQTSIAAAAAGTMPVLVHELGLGWFQQCERTSGPWLYWHGQSLAIGGARRDEVWRLRRRL